jgi:hypothetical protein
VEVATWAEAEEAQPKSLAEAVVAVFWAVVALLSVPVALPAEPSLRLQVLLALEVQQARRQAWRVVVRAARLSAT